MGNENSRIPRPKLKADSTGGSSPFPYVRGSREARLRSHQITREMQKQFSDDAQTVKILLLGSGESGKSTIVKQMKLLHPVNKRTECGFSLNDKKVARNAVYSNISDAIINLIGALDDLNIKLLDDEDKVKMEESKSTVFKYFDMLQTNIQMEPKRNCFSVSNGDEEKVISPSSPGISSSIQLSNSASCLAVPDNICPNPEVISALKYLWSSPSIQKAYERRHEFQLIDSAAYFLNDLDRVCVHDFEPTDEDVLRTRVKTIGIVRIEFAFRHLTFSMFDVAGQRSERRKWIHCFDNVTSVLFIVGISEYDQVLAEDHKVNRMTDSLKLFEETVNGIHLRNKPFILFFNKHDLFEEKVKRKSIQCAFPYYRGEPHSVHESGAHIVSKFMELDKYGKGKRPIYTHLVTATNTQLVKFVFTGVAEIILNDILRETGLT